MNYDEIFQAYYALYRAEGDTPDNDDDEYVVGMNYANEAVNRWANYDSTYWKQLFQSLQLADDGDKIINTSNTYAAPEDMKEAGGFVRALDGRNTVQRWPILEPHEVQFKGDSSTHCFFTGNPSEGFNLTVNPFPDQSLVGKQLDYVYYRKPSTFLNGNSTSEVPDSYFIIHRMLAMRFRASRNWSAYQTALRDSEDMLKIMKVTNDTGSWANPWKLQDNSGTSWGS